MNWSFAIKLSLGTLSLDVAIEGDLTPVAIIGPNGAGKTTLLRTLAGAYRPESGHIRFGDRILFDGTVDEAPETRKVGYVPQGYGLFPHLTVCDNVAFGVEADSLNARREVARAMLEQLGSSSLAERAIASLSGGEKQRVALARALIRKPACLLLDEPLAALDAKARRSLRRALAKHIGEAEIPALVVTHDVRDVRALGAYVVVVEEGRVVQEGTAEALMAAPKTDFVAEFFDVPERVNSVAHESDPRE